MTLKDLLNLPFSMNEYGDIFDADGKEAAGELDDNAIHAINTYDDMVEALKAARAAFIVDYAPNSPNGISGVSYDSNALRPVIVVLDEAIAKAKGLAK